MKAQVYCSRCLARDPNTVLWGLAHGQDNYWLCLDCVPAILVEWLNEHQVEIAATRERMVSESAPYNGPEHLR